MGWAGLSNGKLLAQACQQFDVFLTVDQNVQFQQNLSLLPLPVGIMVSSDNRYETLRPYALPILDWLSKALSREVVRIEADGKLVRVLIPDP